MSPDPPAGPVEPGGAGGAAAPPAVTKQTGPALALAALARARAAADSTRRATESGSAARRRREIRGANAATSASAARERRGGDSPDPVPFGASVTELLSARGWQAHAAVAGVTANWERTVGADIAAHSRPLSLREGVLTIEAESTAWATQIRLLAPAVLARIAGESGAGVVSRLVVHGPTGPSWTHGRLRAPGRGPRDTYG